MSAAGFSTKQQKPVESAFHSYNLSRLGFDHEHTATLMPAYGLELGCFVEETKLLLTNHPPHACNVVCCSSHRAKVRLCAVGVL